VVTLEIILLSLTADLWTKLPDNSLRLQEWLKARRNKNKDEI
jgi:hypothetical protein